MADFRIDVGFFNHIKTKRLRKRLGLEGVFALQILWAYAALHEHDESKIYTSEDIELAVDWDGDGDISEVLCEVGYLDRADGGFKIHQWEIHNGYAATASKRSEAGRIAAKARWDKRLHSDGNASAMRTHSDGNAPFPIPNPIPDSKEETPLPPTGDEAQKPKKKRTAKDDAYTPEFDAAWNAYPRKDGKRKAFEAWQKAITREMPIADMPAHIEARTFEPDWRKENGQYIPHKATWLNRDGWLDAGAKIECATNNDDHPCWNVDFWGNPLPAEEAQS